MSKMLASFGLSGVRDIQVLGTMATKIDDVKRSMNLANKAFEENTALDQEFNAQKESLNNQMVLLKNNLTIFAVKLGNELMPIVKDLVQNALIPFLKWATDFAKAHPGIFKVALALAGIVSVVGPILWAIGAMVSGISGLITAWTFLSAAFIAVKTVLGTVLAVFAGLISWPVVIGAAIIGLIETIWIFRDKFNQKPNETKRAANTKSIANDSKHEDGKHKYHLS